MTLIFNDDTSIEVRVIYGEPRLVNDLERDVLRIELDQNQSLDELREIFSDINKTCNLYHCCNNGEQENVKEKMGEGYCILLDVFSETQKVKHMPGFIRPPEYININVVMLAQYTYDEWMEFLASRENEE